MEKKVKRLMCWYIDRGFKIHMVLGFVVFLVTILLRRFDLTDWAILFVFSSFGLPLFILLFVVLGDVDLEEDEVWKLVSSNVIEGECHVVEPKGLPKPN